MGIGIIGFGRFGRLATRYLAQDCAVVVHSRHSHENEIKALGARQTNIDEVCAQEIVLLCVPISAMQKTLQSIKKMLRKGAIVADVCSVKSYPAKLMKAILPNHVQILATHPLFGPDSAGETLKGRSIVLCDVRIGKKELARIRDYLKKRGLEVIEASAQEHDRETAISLFLNHYLARAALGAGHKDIRMKTKNYDRLNEIIETVKNDSLQLFQDMHRYNPYAKKAIAAFKKSLQETDRRLKQ